ncbi:hypothetical protein GCM10009780_61690 [Actinomadura alba]
MDHCPEDPGHLTSCSAALVLFAFMPAFKSCSEKVVELQVVGWRGMRSRGIPDMHYRSG